MVRKLRSFQVLINDNRQVFYPGEQVTGYVQIDIAEPIKCRKILVRITGQAHCYWTTQRTTQDSEGHTHTHTDHHTGNQNLIDLQSIVFGGSSESVRHPSGRHDYAFSFTLPSPLPSSFEGGTGHIRYFLEAKVDRPWKFDHKFRRPFTVNEIIDINLPQYLAPLSNTKQKQIGCLCCIAGNLNIQASIDRSGYCPGEQIFITASCDNDSTRQMDCMKAKLIQHILFKAGDGTTTGATRTIARFEGKPIPEKSQDSWNNQPFLIPAIPPTIQTVPVSVSYYFKFEIKVPWGFDPEIVFGITIGTVPFREMFGNQSSYQLAENQYMEEEFSNWVPPTAPVMPSAPPPPSSILGYPDMPPPSYAFAVGGVAVDVGDTNSKSNFGDQSYMPMYTYAQPFQSLAYPPPNASPSSGYPQAGNPTTVYPPSGGPSQGYPPAGNPTTGYPPAGNPTTGYPPAGNPTTGHPPAGYPTAGYPPDSAPPLV
ncbi:arrestin domain-containing protein 3-like isoform X2 [Xenia sp. Carnegie-2017]|uniref:arrestin domain-containing protein 3-like isoform X2 n=1 Tax=Xenia sp. Carnegie-2017 TaxID=2897299 RepID=UPI001F036D9A|nr:arrestin domain-containing protein 3-like isoform X2 [Xenia sp. Carnegie-2017]